VREFLAHDLTPLAIYRRLRERSPHSFLLESVTGGDQVSRYSFLGSAPAEIYRLYRDRLEIESHDQVATFTGELLGRLRERLSAFRADPGSLPFAGGFVGYFGYDLVRLVEDLESQPYDPFGLPVVQLARFDSVVVFDHARQRLTAVANEIDGVVGREAAEAALEELSRLLLAPSEERLAVPVPVPEERDGSSLRPRVADSEFELAVETAKKYIRAGDILQAVLARRWEVPAEVDPEALYRAVRLINPSPYMVLLEGPDLALVGASPEMLVRKSGTRLETRPIAGTRPRGATPEEDRALARELLADEKERAEHIMLVDLGRNDLGRVAKAGSVAVASFMEVERYSHVMHLVSSVEAELEDGLDAMDALLACFPAGTVSGAPKIRAMQIVDELETEARGPYAGAVGYLSYSGDLDTCITIRTLMAHAGKVSVTAGAGIVADSIPRREAEETKNKAAALLAAVELARSLEEAG
jgi:anthranilate synthase component 1